MSKWRDGRRGVPAQGAQAYYQEIVVREKKMYRTFGKRVLDVAIVVPGLILAFPLMLFVAVLVRINLGNPVVFRQLRPGLYGQPFLILKFRTMTDACDNHGQLLPDDARLTCLGAWLRSTSLDELPELFNVLFGQMSLVGPRPLLIQYLPLYTAEQARRIQSILA